jgi:CRP-like cAMP-binding protein
MNGLIDHFRQFNIVPQEELERVAPHVREIRLDKNEHWLRPGQTCRHLAFIQSGLLRSYFNGKGEEHTNCIRFAGDVMTAYTSFITGHASLEGLQALTPCTLEVLPKDIMETHYRTSRAWQELGRMFAELAYIELEERVQSFQLLTAAERYAQLMDKHPQLILEIPLQHIASYLGISRETLSRIRTAGVPAYRDH